MVYRWFMGLSGVGQLMRQTLFSRSTPTYRPKNSCGVMVPSRWKIPPLSRHCQKNSVGGVPRWMASMRKITSITVSYTHLRAHETRHDLVCRLLLEKKKDHSI